MDKTGAVLAIVCAKFWNFF